MCNPLYSRDVDRFGTLCQDEETRLGRLACQGDRGARNRLVEGSLRLALHFAGLYTHRATPLVDADDLVSAANLGLIRAADKFNPGHGARFSTYAARWIRCFIERAILEAGTVHAPDAVLKKAGKILRAYYAWEQVHGRVPSVSELAAETGCPVKQVEWLLRVRQPVASIEDLGDDHAVTYYVEVVEMIDADTVTAVVAQAMCGLPEHERVALQSYYELNVEGAPKPEHYSARRHAAARREGLRTLAGVLPRSIAEFSS